jgi:hypothetical protein
MAKTTRRQFHQTLGAAALLGGLRAEAAPMKSHFYTLERYQMKNGDQPARLHEYLSTGLLPAAAKLHDGPVIVLDALVAAHMPSVVLIRGYSTMTQPQEIADKLGKDEKHMAAFHKWESGNDSTAERWSTSLLASTPYMTDIVADKDRKTPRIFELRQYHSPTWRQLGALNERFGGPEIRIFHRVGIHPILYSTTVFGDNIPNLTYLTPFENLAEREKAWTAFGADEEWLKVRKESIEKSGQISQVMEISLWRAAAYSPIK